MYFQIGAHPAFYWPDFNADTQNRGFFGFDKEEGLKYILISEKGCADPSTEYSSGTYRRVIAIGYTYFR